MSNRALSVFCAKCEEMIDSKYILADKKIANLLKSVVASQELKEILSMLLKEFNYEVEFLKTKSQVYDIGAANKFRIDLTNDRTVVIPYVFCMLSEFENKTKDLYRFLTDYFYEDGNMFESYSSFCRQIILPFRDAFMSYFETNTGESETNAVKKDNLIDAAVVEEFLVVMQEFTQNLASDSSVKLDKKHEMMTVAEGLTNAIVTRDVKLIKTLWIGFKNTFKKVKSVSKFMDALEFKFKENKIISGR